MLRFLHYFNDIAHYFGHVKPNLNSVNLAEVSMLITLDMYGKD